MIIQFLFISQDAALWYGIDWDGPIATCEQDEISVPEVSCPITPAQLVYLKDIVDPLTDCHFHGVELYSRVRSFVEENMHE